MNGGPVSTPSTPRGKYFSDKLCRVRFAGRRLWVASSVGVTWSLRSCLPSAAAAGVISPTQKRQLVPTLRSRAARIVRGGCGGGCGGFTSVIARFLR